MPAAEHSANFFYLFRYKNIFFTLENFCFPGNHKQNFKCIGFADSKPNPRLFFFTRKEACDGYCLDNFYKTIINLVAQGIFMSFRKKRIKINPS